MNLWVTQPTYLNEFICEKNIRHRNANLIAETKNFRSNWLRTRFNSIQFPTLDRGRLIVMKLLNINKKTSTEED